MSEIQSAEEFVKFIDDNYINLGAMTKQTITDAIRARDKAIVERIHKMIYQESDCSGDDSTGESFTNIRVKTVYGFLDDVLRELGGEQ